MYCLQVPLCNPSQISYCLEHFSLYFGNRKTSIAVSLHDKSRQLCLILCNSVDCSPPSSSVPGILQARTLEWGCHFLLPCMKMKSESELAQSCPTLGDPMDCSLPGCSVHGIFQARVLEWGAIAFSITSANMILYPIYLSTYTVHSLSIRILAS